VLEQVQSALPDCAGTGMSILEVSHRSATYEALHNQAIADLRTLLGGTEEHTILFMSGGAQMQFALVALNLLCPGSYAEYLVTGVRSETALSEAYKIGDARVLWSSATTTHTRIPLPGEFHIEAGAAYVHYTSNNTIVGTQYTYVPATRDVPLVCDMSSDLLSCLVELSHYSLIYAEAQRIGSIQAFCVPSPGRPPPPVATLRAAAAHRSGSQQGAVRPIAVWTCHAEEVRVKPQGLCGEEKQKVFYAGVRGSAPPRGLQRHPPALDTRRRMG
jgi:Aminotransferase class-V